MWGRKGLGKLVAKSSVNYAKGVSKGNFLRQLHAAWYPHVKKHTPIEGELEAAMARIHSSPFKDAFEQVGISESDIRAVLEEIRQEKVDPIKREQKVGRNEPCPCGSGKKYKWCHGA